MKISIFTSIFYKLRLLLNKRQKIILLFILGLTITLSVIETLGIAVIMPFIAIATDPSLLDKGNYKIVYDFCKNLFGFESKINFIIVFGFGVFIFYIFRAFYNIAYTYIQNRFSISTYRHFSAKLFNVILNVPYKSYSQKNSGELMQVINNEASATNQLMLSVLQVCSEVFTALMLYVFIFVSNWKITLALSAVMAIIVWFIIEVLIKKIKRVGVKRAEAARVANRILVETLGNFKFVKIKGTEDENINKYVQYLKKQTDTQVLLNVFNNIPKLLLETLGFSLLIGMIIFILWREHSVERIIPVIAMYTITLYKLLPSINKIMQQLNIIAYSYAALDRVIDALKQDTEIDGDLPVEFNSSITLKDVSFEYVDNKTVLKDISFTIKKGEKIAITGESGGGKSTLADLIIGINKPTRGALYADDVQIDKTNIRSWRRKIGYIPQNVYLYDGTVGENVAFGSDYNKERIIEVLKMANIWNYLEEHGGIDSKTGEGGVQLSGGQKQRIGIARALYDNPEVLVLDEATSALDTETETRIMDEIYKIGAGKTLIIIAHRLSTIERCERRIRIENGKIKETKC